MSETKYGFTRFDTIDEFKSWLNKQNISRSIKRLQVHHTYLPSYAQWPEDELTRQYNMKRYHVDTNRWADIAQQFTIFPNGKIVTGRSLESTPVGIKGWNTYAICIEIYGNFDKNGDVMYNEQKEAVIACYALLCDKFALTPNDETIRCHGWFTSGGTYLGGYDSSKSCKTCPGTNFMEIGNTKSGFQSVFYPSVKEYMERGLSLPNIAEIYRVIVDELNIRNGPGINHDIVGVIDDKGSYTITKLSGSWGYLKSELGWINISTSYCTKVK